MQNLWQLPWYSAHLQRDGWRWIGSIGLALAVGVGYLLTALVSLALLTKPDEVAVFWPAAGIAAGTLIALGPKARLPVTLAVLTASAAASLLSGRNLPAAIVFALCNAGEALFVAWLIKQRFGKDFRLNSLRSVLGFFAAAGVGPAISGAVATAGFVLFYSSGAPLLTTWLNWLASDALGIIMVAPLLIGLAGLRRDLPERWELTEGTLTLAALAAVGAIAFGSPAHNWWCTVLPLGLLLPALLAAHCRPVFAAAAALILGFAVVWTTTFGIGELGELSSLPDRAYAARTTLLAISTYTLVLAALFAERRHQEAALADSNNRLKASNDRLQLALSGAELGVWSTRHEDWPLRERCAGRANSCLPARRPAQNPCRRTAFHPCRRPADIGRRLRRFRACWRQLQGRISLGCEQRWRGSPSRALGCPRSYGCARCRWPARAIARCYTRHHAAQAGREGIGRAQLAACARRQVRSGWDLRVRHWLGQIAGFTWLCGHARLARGDRGDQPRRMAHQSSPG